MADWRTDPEVVAAREAAIATSVTDEGHCPFCDEIVASLDAYGAAVQQAVLASIDCPCSCQACGYDVDSMNYNRHDISVCHVGKARAEGATG